jgi:hypothetical protein
VFWGHLHAAPLGLGFPQREREREILRERKILREREIPERERDSPRERERFHLAAAASLAGLPLPAAYLARPEEVPLQGTSFAIAGAVIDNQTGTYPVNKHNLSIYLSSSS